MAAVGRFLLLIALVASPWVFGCVQPWPQFLLAAAICGLVLLRAVESVVLRPDQSIHLPLAAAAPVVLLVIAAFQLLPREAPLPTGMRHAVFGEDAGVYEAAGHDSIGTLSASDTRREAARLYLALAAFLLATQWFADPSTHRGLLAALAFNGAALGGFGIVQRLSWNGRLFWTVDLDGGTPFASYVNRNNAAGYLNLCLGGAIGLAILLWWQPARSHVRLRGLADRIRLAAAQLDAARLTSLALLVVTAAGVLFSLSRGGIVALAIAAVVVLGSAFRGVSRSSLALLCGVLLACAVGLVVYTGQFEQVDERMDSLADPWQAARGRLAHWTDTAAAVTDFPLTGTGQGTYRYANPPYQRRPSHAWYYNADNQWFELLVEQGAIALGAMVLGLLLIGSCAVLLLRRADPQSRAMGACGLFVILTQGIQAFTDFGLTLPANALTFAVIAGALCGTACQAAQFQRIRIPLWLSLAQVDGRFGHSLLNLALAGAAGGFLLELYSATTAEAARERGSEAITDQLPPAALDPVIDRMREALTLRPDDGALHEALGRTLIDRCHLELYHQLLREVPETTAAQQRSLWTSSAPALVGLRARQLAAAGSRGELARLRRIEAIQEYVVPATEHFATALRHCPLARNSALWLVRLAPLVSKPSSQSEDVLLTKARFVAPSTPAVLFELAALADQSGHTEFAAECWHRGLELEPDNAAKIWPRTLAVRQPEEALSTAIPPRVDVLVQIAETVEDPQLQQMIAERADQLWNQQKSAVPPVIAARLDELRSRPEEAIGHYRLALGGAPWDSTTRLKLARLLHRQGRLSEAVAEYSLLRQQLPNRKDIEQEFVAARMRELESPGRPADAEAAQQTPKKTSTATGR